MRSLTIGAVIVCGGTIAALPFRRASVDPAPHTASHSPVSDFESELAVTNDNATYDPSYDPWYVDPHANGSVRESRTRSSTAMSLASQAQSPETMRGIPSDAQPRPRRDLRLPLTYDDLAVPLTATQFSDGRFDALASRQTSPQQPRSNPMVADSRQYESMRVAADDQPNAVAKLPPWQMADDLPQSILQKTSRPSTSSTSSETASSGAPQPSAVVGRLASDSRPNQTEVVTEPAPARQRYWIRQPD